MMHPDRPTFHHLPRGRVGQLGSCPASASPWTQTLSLEYKDSSHRARTKGEVFAFANQINQLDNGEQSEIKIIIVIIIPP